MGLGLATDARVGLFLGFPLVFVAMLLGLSYWAERFAGRRWLTRAMRLDVRTGAEDYRGTQALDLRVDGQRRAPKHIYLNTAERPGIDTHGAYSVLVDSDSGLVEVDTFRRQEDAALLAEALRVRLGVDVSRADAGPAHGGDSTVDGLLTWCAMAAPVVGFLPMLLIAPNPAWVPTMSLMMFVVASLALDARVRTTASTTAEEQFRARLRSTPARARVEAMPEEHGEVAPLEARVPKREKGSKGVR